MLSTREDTYPSKNFNKTSLSLKFVSFSLICAYGFCLDEYESVGKKKDVKRRSLILCDHQLQGIKLESFDSYLCVLSVIQFERTYVFDLLADLELQSHCVKMRRRRRS